MKKTILALASAVVLCFISCSATLPGSFAETTYTEDFSFLENMEEYSYDRFTKEWKYRSTGTTEQNVSISIYFQGKGNDITFSPIIFFGSTRYGVPEVAYFLIGEDVYKATLHSDDYLGGLILGLHAKNLLEALSHTDSIVLRLTTGSKNIDIELAGSEYEDLIRRHIVLLLEHHVIECYDQYDHSSASFFKNMCPIEKY